MNPYIVLLQQKAKLLDADTGGGRGIRAGLRACEALGDDCGNLDSVNRRAVALALLSTLVTPDRLGQMILELRDWLYFRGDE